jgi:hypothetical protein
MTDITAGDDGLHAFFAGAGAGAGAGTVWALHRGPGQLELGSDRRDSARVRFVCPLNVECWLSTVEWVVGLRCMVLL